MTNRFSSVTMAALVLAATAQAAGALQLGDAMPMTTVKMKSVSGKEVTLSGVAGPKGTLVIFSCNHCPWVKAWETRIAALGNELPAKGIGVVAINSNDPAAYPGDDCADMVKRAKARGFAFPYVVDSTSDVARAFGATHTPEVFLFDGAGAEGLAKGRGERLSSRRSAQRRSLPRAGAPDPRGGKESDLAEIHETASSLRSSQ